MIGIAWRILRRSPGTLFGAFIMITVGTALLAAFAIVQDSISRTTAPVERYAAADVVASGQAGVFTPEAVEEAGGLPGVAEAVPELSFPALVLGADGHPPADWEDTARFGHGWSSAGLTPFLLLEGRAPDASDEVVLDAESAAEAGAGVGDRVDVEVAGTVRGHRLVGVVEAEAGPTEYQRALFFTDRRAAELAARGGGRSDAIGLHLEPGADPGAVAAALDERLRSALAGDVDSPSGVPAYRVGSGAERGELEQALPDHRASAQAMAMLIWIVAFMAVAVIGGALITSVRSRAEQFALLRAVGATPGQVRLLCLAEAFLLSLAGVAAGALSGMLLGRLLLEGFRAIGVVSPVLRVHYGPGALLIAGVTALVVGQAAAWFAARAALRIRPAEVLAGQAAVPVTRGRRRVGRITGALLLAAAGILQALGMAGLVPAVLRGAYGMIASGLVIVGLGLLGSWAIHAAARAVRPLLSWAAPVAGHLAAANVGFHHRRYAGAAVPIAVGTAIAGWALAGLPLFALGNSQDVAERFAADQVLRTPIVRDAHTGLGEPVRERLEEAPGVSAAVGLRELWAHAAPPGSGGPGGSGAPEVTRGTVVTGRAGALLDLGEVTGDLASVGAGRGVALGAAYARQAGIGLHDEVEVRTAGASRPTVLPVVALFERDKGGGEGIVVASEALRDAPRGWYDYVLVGEEKEGRAAEAAAAVLSARGTASAEDPEEFLRAYVQERQGAIDNLGTLATAMVGGFLVIASVNALALSAADRRSELASIRRIGVTGRRLSRMVSWEMALTVVPAWLLGGLATAWMAAAMAGGDLGAALWAYPGAVLLGFGAAGLAAALLGALAATRSALRAADAR
ncbi:ABC transporter permease [Nocardiopsis potens]|uniref:ABC transporter permease n=1 Tax=Nocardiopsis potens TaxID=1246458 RepID=UPI000345AD31|nr:ABC transporter permease [Nocardiopsis potens]